MEKKLNRRKLLAQSAQALGGTLLADQLLGLGIFESLCTPFEKLFSSAASFDAYELMNSSVLGSSGLWRLSQAFAADQVDDWMHVTIKVFNQVHTPLVFARGKLNGTTTSLDASVPKVASRLGAATASLSSLGVDQISTIARYRQLRFNNWFASILQNGFEAGTSLAPADSIAPLSDKVAIQAFLHLRQIAAVTHSLRGTKVRDDMADLCLYLAQNGLINSPLGITCLMMGGNYDRAEGNLSKNAVLGPEVVETQKVLSRSVAQMSRQLTQFINGGYVSHEANDKNLILQLDKLIDADFKTRRELFTSLEALKQAAPKLAAVSTIEQQRQTFNAARSNGQSSVAGSGASLEFIAQCLYVREAARIPGKPFRNFSLFLNTVDLDARDMDTITNQLSTNDDTNTIQSLTYVEGMRQLAIGLNILGKVIAEGHKVIVSVVTEGGRSADLADSHTGFALVMGPRGPGHLDDYLYANLNEMNKTSSALLSDMGVSTSAVPWDTDEGLMTQSGSRLPGQAANMGDVQMGVVEFLESQQGKNTRSLLSDTQARYVKLKRFG